MVLHRPLAPVLVLLVALRLAACETGAPPEPDPPDVGAPVPTPPDDPEPDPDDPAAPTPEEEPPPDEEPADDPDLSAVAITLTEVARGDAPTAGVAGPDDAVWIAERPGRVRILDADGLGDPVIDLADRTTTEGERGLLGIAFDEDFEHLYVSYTDPEGHSRVDELAMDGGLPEPGSQRTVLAVDQPYANHNGGNIVVGSDGMLYLGLGDGGAAADPLEAGQDLGTLLGKLLRIDPAGGDPYGIPADNPFVDDPDARDEIWAYGLRNPWRFSFDAATDDLWIADVGERDREEVNWMPDGEGAGANYGWNLMEGTLPFAGSEPEDHVPPVYEYETSASRCAITGGYVYRGDAVPALRGAYLYSDYCEGVVRALHVRDGEVVEEADLGVDAGQAVSFAEDAGGELFVLDLGGRIFRIDPG